MGLAGRCPSLRCYRAGCFISRAPFAHPATMSALLPKIASQQGCHRRRYPNRDTVTSIASSMLTRVHASLTWWIFSGTPHHHRPGSCGCTSTALVIVLSLPELVGAIPWAGRALHARPGWRLGLKRLKSAGPAYIVTAKGRVSCYIALRRLS